MSKPQAGIGSWVWLSLVALAFAGGFIVRGTLPSPATKTIAEAEENGTTDRKDRRSLSGQAAAAEKDGANPNHSQGRGISLEAKAANVMGMKHPADRITAWIRELDGMTAENALTYLNALDAADPEAKRKLEWQILIRKWMTLDANACTQYIASLPVETKTHFAIDVAMNRWAETDPGAAADFIQGLAGTPLHDTALYSYIGRVGTTDLDGAIAMAERAWAGKPQEYNRSMERLHGEFLFANPGGDSKAFFSQIPSEEGKRAAFGHVFYRLSNQSTDEAAEWLVTERDFATDRAISRIVEAKNAANSGSGDQWKAAHFP